MIERVARAIYETTRGRWTGISWDEVDHDNSLREARAAIAAMRPPFVAALTKAEQGGFGQGDWADGYDSGLATGWERALELIDAALSDTKEPR